MFCRLKFLVFFFCISGVLANEEFKIKRENIFTFKKVPTIINEDGIAKISFETDGFCDVTVVIEDSNGKIIRHLASGVLGDNPPEQFQSKSKIQTIVWDYKDDEGLYPKNLGVLNVRVSLGLKPQFERTLFWAPEKRINRQTPTVIASSKKGVLTFEGEGRDQLKLYSHIGEYQKTIYPFSNKDISNIKSLTFKTMPQEGKTLPLKFGNKHFSTFLKTGSNVDKVISKYGQAASALVVHGDKIGLIGWKLGFLTLGDDLDNICVDGPSLTILGKTPREGEIIIPPRSAAVSPDGKWLYLAGYMGKNFVQRIAFNKEGILECFVGASDGKRGDGDKENEFDGVASVACDSQGRVYVADYCNNRIQIFSEKGDFLKSIKFNNPHIIQVDPNNGDIYVSSWLCLLSEHAKDGPEKPTLTRLGNFDNPVIKSKFILPFIEYSKTVFMNHGNWMFYNVHIDFFDKQPVIWVLPGRVGTNSELWMARGLQVKTTEASCMKLFIEDGKVLKKISDFGPIQTSTVKRFVPPVIARQRLFVNPKNEKLYVAEGDSGVMKSFQELVEIDPKTGKVELIKLPFTTEDLCFDHNGLVYLRTDLHIVRYDPQTWHEIPFDYGIELDKVGFQGLGKINPPIISAINLPTIGKPGQFHLGGIAINHKLNLIVSCYNSRIQIGDCPPLESSVDFNINRNGGSKYFPQIYPGRVSYGEIHMWSRNGQMIKQDIFPGLGLTDGIAIDNDDNVYVLADGARVINGEPFFDRCSETLIKAKPNKVKVISDNKRAEIPLQNAHKPERPHDIQYGSIGGAWFEGADWMYGGVGFAGFSVGYAPACACWNARFTLDYLKRSFAPEITHYSVAVLDSNGNLILRIGKYGNIDDGQPIINEGGPKLVNSIGGDEVALMHAAYLATETDKRLFIADAGNSRILSVRLRYYAQKIIPIKVPDFANDKQ